MQSSNNCPTRSATTSLLIRYSEVGTDRPNRQRLLKRSNIAQQLNSVSRKTRRSSIITRQWCNNWQRQRNAQITQDGRSQGSAKGRRILLTNSGISSAVRIACHDVNTRRQFLHRQRRTSQGLLQPWQLQHQEGSWLRRHLSARPLEQI